MAHPLPVVVVGAGISGVAAARALTAAGVDVRVIDRGRRVGGRMAVRTEEIDGAAHPVDIGAAYFTGREEAFLEVMSGWRARGLARPWTDTFHLGSADGLAGTTSGPMRWAAALGLRSLVEDLAEGLDVVCCREVEAVGVGTDGRVLVDGEPAAAAVLAMPDPQAADLLPDDVAERLGIAGARYAAAITVWALWPRRWWPPDLDGAFVDGSPVISWVADDGRRRGDGVPLLVAHTTSVLAEQHLDDPVLAVQPVLAELARVLAPAGANARAAPPDPEFTRVHRWSLAAPRRPHPEPFGLVEAAPGAGTGPFVGVCGDGWGPRPRVEQAWLSGHRLGLEIAARLGRTGGDGTLG